MKKWRENNLKEHNDRNKRWRDKWKGIPETEFQERIKQEFQAYSLDEIHPDLYDSERRRFIEVKRALPFRKAGWTAISKYFPNFYFYRIREHTKTPSLDKQIEQYPRPLLIVVFHALTGEELIRKEFGGGKGWVEVREDLPLQVSERGEVKEL